jgi:sugar lactone lactonase YvrE
MIPIEDVNIYAEGLDHPECVLYHPDGSVWAGGEAGQVYRIDPQGTMEIVTNTGGFILGMALSPDKSWMAICDSHKKCIWRLDLKTLELSIFARGVSGHDFAIPNYVCFDSKSHLYASESGAFRRVLGKILKFGKDGTGYVWHEGPFNFANGIALDSSERFLYVVNTFAHSIERISISEDGSAGQRETFVTFDKVLPDGIAFDREENLLVACYTPSTIFKVAPDRSVTTLIDDWEAHTLCNPTNIAFGGKDLNKLFVANLGRWHISVLVPGISGLPLPCHY